MVTTEWQIPTCPGDNETREILRKMDISESDLYDRFDTEGIDNPLYPTLTAEEVEDALRYKQYLRGVMLATGMPGSGKDLLAIVLSHKIKRYFQGRRIILDFKPKPLFGPYLPFDEQFLNEELGKMAEISKFRGEVPKEIDRKDKLKVKEIKKLAKDWVESVGQTYFPKTVLVLSELKKYLHNRHPFNPMGITIGHIVTRWRHFDMLIIGTTPFKREIDAISFLPYLTHEVRCNQRTDGHNAYKIYQTTWVNGQSILNLSGKIARVTINGGEERGDLGGKRYFDLYNSWSITSVKG